MRFEGKPLHAHGPTFFRSYGGNLPSSLERVLSSALGFSPRPPVSDYGTEDHQLHARLFLEAEHQGLRPCGLAPGLGDDCPTFSSYGTPLHQETGTCGTQPALAFSVLARFNAGSLRRNINLLPIAYAFRPQLRLRLTLGGLTFPRKPWAYGERVFHPFYRYSYRHQHSESLHRFLIGPASLQLRRSPTTPSCDEVHSFGSTLEPRYIFGAA